MPDDLVIEDDEARKHLDNLEALYTVAETEVERHPKFRNWPNTAKIRRALEAVVEAYSHKLIDIGDEVFRMTGHHVMARWSREKLEAHSPGATGDGPI